MLLNEKMATSSSPVSVHNTITAQSSVHAPVLTANTFNGPVYFTADSKHGGTAHAITTPEDVPVKDTAKHHDYTNVSRRLKNILKLDYERILDGNSLTGHRKYLNDIYTDLYVVENETGGVVNEHEVRHIESILNRPAVEDMPIRCNDIFKVQCDTDRRNRKVLTMGIAGVGKTISVNKFILDWAEGRENEDIVFIFPLPFRELNLIKKDCILMELLHKNFFSSTKLQSLPEDEGKVLFIFDGLDECRFHLSFDESESVADIHEKTTVSKIVTNLISRSLLPSALIWITSRPAAASQIPRDYIDQVTEVRGFNNEQKEQYFKNNSKPVSEKIISHIRKSRSLYIMCHIPVFCWISVTVLQPLLAQENHDKTPTTLTGMYTNFLLRQMLQMKKKYWEASHKNVDFQHIILRLGSLAFSQLEKGNLIFYKEDLEECGLDVSEGSVYSGLCTQIFKEEKGSSERMVYSFVHLSVQEFLAALYLFCLYKFEKRNPFSQTLKEKCKWFFKNSSFYLHKAAVKNALQSKNGHLDLFLRFLLGLSLESNQDDLKELLPTLKIEEESTRDTAEYIKKKIRVAESAERTMNLFYCLSELKDDSLMEEIQKYLSSGSLSSQTLSSVQWSALVFVLLMSEETQETFELQKYRRTDEALMRLLPVIKNTRRALLNNCKITKDSCSSLASVLSSNYLLTELDLSNNDLQDSGVKLLSHGLKISKLVTLRLSGCMVTKEGCSYLASALSSNHSHLKELDLSYNHPEDSGERLLRNLNLETINLDHGGDIRIKPGLRKYSCNLTLDPDTAHTDLQVSEDNRKVTWLKEKHQSPDHPERFDQWSQVLCREGLTGRYYWEAEWSEIGAHVGVSYKGISRKGRKDECWFGQNAKSWSLDCTKDKYVARHNKNKVVIPATGPCSYVIGVYLDWSAGTLSFYSVSDTHTLTHLHTFNTTFTEPLFAGFLVIDSTVSLRSI
ncbi:LOW QUALITY PROTEIN: protein NLRC3-like [Xyrauchen texanus]|uniref:LOW QUALITY PROTEIN: protein NLRC3-like n=1 Tax=Xyrauchen texanus TaxID=154827 RepID=UPI0022423006|nr:LOW QUALITY PROTEIN: protein NLRC3-like [Xyrauchen texanus]